MCTSAVQERYEKLSGELSAANDRLARAYAQLESASMQLEAEKRKGDALLYQVGHMQACGAAGFVLHCVLRACPSAYIVCCMHGHLPTLLHAHTCACVGTLRRRTANALVCATHACMHAGPMHECIA